MIITLVFDEDAILVAENLVKTQKMISALTCFLICL
jgi:hypothetical protein